MRHIPARAGTRDANRSLRQMLKEYTIEPLNGERIKDWLGFFESRAFADNPWWGSCYCTHFHRGKDGEGKPNGMTNRAFASWLIETGQMQGYLVYSPGGIVVGWCNANDRQAYMAFTARPSETGGKAACGSESKGKTKALVCFVIEKTHRRQGLATALLQRVIADARSDGYQSVEAYPSARARSEAGNYRGPLNLYIKNGFSLEKQGRRTVARLRLAVGF